MYFFYNPTTRKIISATEMELSTEELQNFISPGREVLEEEVDNLPDWKYELSDYYVSLDGQILKALEYEDFRNVISIQAGSTYNWTVLDDNTELYDIQRSTNIALTKGDTITFSSVDPGIYEFELSSIKYKTCIITLEVTL